MYHVRENKYQPSLKLIQYVTCISELQITINNSVSQKRNEVPHLWAFFLGKYTHFSTCSAMSTDFCIHFEVSTDCVINTLPPDKRPLLTSA